MVVDCPKMRVPSSEEVSVTWMVVAPLLPPHPLKNKQGTRHARVI
jgi:hypothetical protein